MQFPIKGDAIDDEHSFYTSLLCSEQPGHVGTRRDTSGHVRTRRAILLDMELDYCSGMQTACPTT